MLYKVEIQVKPGEVWEHIETGRCYAVIGTLPGEVQIDRDGLTTTESPGAFANNYRRVTLRGIISR